MIRSFVRLFPLLILLFCVSAFSFEEERLWLPLSYQTLYLKLKDAAAAAESLERCTEVLEGTIDLSQGSRENPIFRIHCRLSNGRTYNEMVDGTTNETLTTKQVVAKELSLEELELQRLEAEKRKLQEKRQRIEGAWHVCNQKWLEKTRLMINVRSLHEILPEPGVSSQKDSNSHSGDPEEAIYVFNIDFDADSVGGELLKFQAICTVENKEIKDFVIQKRP